ncbi:hypothetical protein CCP3SC1_670012 [Gammaproteobacteria bacterium]
MNHLTQVATYAVRNEKAPLPPERSWGEGANLFIRPSPLALLPEGEGRKAR